MFANSPLSQFPSVRLRVRTIGQLGRLPLETLQQQFGKSGEQLCHLAQGIDGRCVTPDREAKSISHETIFASDIQHLEVLRAWLQELVE